MSLSVNKKEKKRQKHKKQNKNKNKTKESYEKRKELWVCLRTNNEISSAGRRSTRFLPVEKNVCAHIYCLGSVCSNGFRMPQRYRKQRNGFNGGLKVIAYWLTSCFKINTFSTHSII